LDRATANLDRERKRRLKLFIGNTLYDLAKIVFPNEKFDASTNRVQQLASKATEKQLRKAHAL
jgi:hypothetical protein